MYKAARPALIAGLAAFVPSSGAFSNQLMLIFNRLRFWAGKS